METKKDIAFKEGGNRRGNADREEDPTTTTGIGTRSKILRGGPSRISWLPQREENDVNDSFAIAFSISITTFLGMDDTPSLSCQSMYVSLGSTITHFSKTKLGYDSWSF